MDYDSLVKIYYGMLCGVFLLLFLFVATLSFQDRTGDMNNDGSLTIVDLSILAEEIRNEP